MVDISMVQTLVVFNGEDNEGRKLSYESQLRTFRGASLVIGPHGSGVRAYNFLKICESSYGGSYKV